MDTRHIHISNYQHDLPDDRITKFPIAQRDHNKLLLYNQGKVGEDVPYHLKDHPPQGALMIFSNTRVIQAQMYLTKSTSARIEALLMKPTAPTDREQIFQTRSHCAWYRMTGNLKKWKEGSLTRSYGIKGRSLTLTITRKSQQKEDQAEGNLQLSAPATRRWIEFDQDAEDINFPEILEGMGELPIPPYLNQETQESDKTTYQTVYSKMKGSVTTPTASLHFTNDVLKPLDEYGIDRGEITLHVETGTLKPAKGQEIEDHDMHTGYICVRQQMLEELLQHDANTIAVSTTSVRTLGSLYYMGVCLSEHPDASEVELHVSQWAPYERMRGDGATEQLDRGLIDGITSMQAIQDVLDYFKQGQLGALHNSTQIIIAPGYECKVVKMLITNFHQPRNTPLLLVSAFVHDDWQKIYDYALTHDFRFLNYGGSSLLVPQSGVSLDTTSDDNSISVEHSCAGHA